MTSFNFHNLLTPNIITLRGWGDPQEFGGCTNTQFGGNTLVFSRSHLLSPLRHRRKDTRGWGAEPGVGGLSPGWGPGRPVLVFWHFPLGSAAADASGPKRRPPETTPRTVEKQRM